MHVCNGRVRCQEMRCPHQSDIDYTSHITHHTPDCAVLYCTVRYPHLGGGWYMYGVSTRSDRSIDRLRSETRDRRPSRVSHCRDITLLLYVTTSIIEYTHEYGVDTGRVTKTTSTTTSVDAYHF